MASRATSFPRAKSAAAALALAALLTSARPVRADDARMPIAPLHEDVLSLPGDPLRPVALQVTLFTPPGPGPFPLAVMNHGATNASASNRGERYRFTAAAWYFLSRGYAVALPMMRGFAGSGGRLPQAGCDLAAVAETDARDIRAVTEALARRPDIDGSRIVVAGQSFGAWNTLGVGTSPPPGTRGLISFNAALRSSDCQNQDGSMIAAAGQMGARTWLPSLWFYGDNDSIMPVSTWRAIYDKYRSSGGKAELVAFGFYGNDSHQLLSDPDSLPFWSKKVDAFLSRIGMPATVVHAEYLPHPAPPASHWAAISDVRAVPFLNDAGRTLFRKFLQQPWPRAFVLAPSGSASQFSGGYDPLGRALLACARFSPECRAYAVNDQVVWTGPRHPEASSGTPVRVVAKMVRMNSATSLGAFYAVNPDCSSRGLPTVVIAMRPAHGAASVERHDGQPNFPASSPYAVCNANTVPATGVTYTPANGYSGPDTLTLDETTPDGKRLVIRIDLSVS